MIDIFVDALVRVIDRVQRRLSPRARIALETLREQAEPPPGLVLHSPDGSIFTGLIAVAKSRVIAMLAVREPGSTRPPLVTPPPSPQRHDPYSPYAGRGGYEHQSWEDGELPFR